MEILAVRKAGFIAFLPFEQINPERRALDRVITEKLVSRYHFKKFPYTYEDFNAKDGVVFTDGEWNDVQVDEIRFYPNGILVGTGKSTDVAEELFEDVMTVWSEVGLRFSPEWIRKHAYLSELVVQSDLDLCNLNPRMTSLVSENFKDSGPSIVAFYVDGNPDTSPLQIQRLIGVPATANQFWSQAPIQTDRHIDFLEAVESMLRV